MSTIVKDFMLGARTSLRSPGYSAVTILTLALAIGANTLLFSIANPLLVRSLPLTDPDRLGWIMSANPEREITRAPSSMPDFLEWRAGLTSFSGLAAYALGEGTMTGHGDAKRIQVARATANLFDVWGVRADQGRLFYPDDDAAGRDQVGILTNRYWQEEFNGNSRVIGQTVLVDGKTVTIVGVLPKSIEIGNLALVDVWAPASLDSTAPRDRRTFRVVGRLAPDATIKSADAELQPILESQRRAYPKSNAGWQATVAPTTAALASSETWVILALLGVVVVFVLLIACANLANLVLARLIARRQESAVRLALGASRWRLVRPLIAESLVLGLCGGLLGLALATSGLRLITAVAYEPFMRSLEIDRNVLLFNAALSFATPLLFTLWPALVASRAVSGAWLHGARTIGGRSGRRRRNVLVGAQVALAFSLLVVSALIVQSMLHMRQIRLGFDPRPLLTYRLDLPDARYGDDAARASFVRTVEEELSAVPGATAAGLSSSMPVFESDAVRRLSGTPHDGQTDTDQPWASMFCVSPGYFKAMTMRVLQGRSFDAGDRAGAQPVAMLSEMSAERYFDRIDNGIGRTVTIQDSVRGDRPVTIIGVVSDTRDSQVTRTSPQMYVPFDQWPSASVRAFVKSDDPAARARDVQTVMHRLDPEVPVSLLKTVPTMIDEELASSRIVNGLFAGFAVLALALASAGLFGVISYSVGQRRREIGIRLALGAAPRGIARMIVAEGLKVVAVGISIGLLLAAFLARASSSLLFGIKSTDPLTFAGVMAVILAVAVVATAGPAGRAMRIDPARTLRAD